MHKSQKLPTYKKAKINIGLVEKSILDEIPKTLIPWLTSSGSLTALLEAKAQQPLRVVRTFEGYRSMTLTQKKLMGYKGYQLNRPVLAWVREVKLYGNDASHWIEAQSLFPLPSLKGEAKRIKYLKSIPLGYVLFKRQNKLPNKRVIKRSQNGWKRQTLYNWHSRPLLISETFLANFT